MNSTHNLQSELSQFIGTEKLYPITSRHVLTDGTKYLAENEKSFWLFDAIASHLTRSYEDHFAVARLVVNGSSAVLTLDDGNDNVFATQAIEYTDFPLNEIKLYCSFDGEHWVIMLTSEY
ncbi:MAG: hypothetical protein B7Y59_03920 [Burkholderiales bacterium 35-55-47]|jgi:hypothetical protein|uniref:DUF6876 family protein n=1 Tax=Limnohabitans sp. TaxID=1907725 RepID=UPI000BD46D61|nr:DUF6876 family protein [Limnohabitans sp.]OYY20237.1 MAG: hypothetical protein B7Y59_03920 [Burkholderiales bacterium 35-55-47]OYZ74151.1 MAG: hypothetical protein B7Y06_01095 [Burkholderiales bacterium 24-55-52]OZB01957.1 MAG: hypothetical protein B7X62_03910 [Burkholderiales bacterium 39-55-53]HQR86487.1 hypothetical protein [Limnohabitans sp.]HQS28096.1 hypothetical protein [Limnohabitans sp.]